MISYWPSTVWEINVSPFGWWPFFFFGSTILKYDKMISYWSSTLQETSASPWDVPSCGVKEPTAGMIVTINRIPSHKSIPLLFPAWGGSLVPESSVAMVDMIDQLSSKYLLNTFMVYLDYGYEVGMLLEMLSEKYLLKINGLPGCVVEMIYQLPTKHLLK